MARDWVETIGNFFGALILDGTDVEDVADKYRAQDPVRTVTDLTGNTGKTFGMHFNGFATLPKERTFDASLPVETEGSPYYATQPLLYVVSDPDAHLKLSLPEAPPNAAAAVVRIK